jgi:hypothetical protein
VDAVVPTESTALGVFRLGYSKLGDGGLCDRLEADRDALNKKKASNAQDALIAEVAIANGYALLTATTICPSQPRSRGARYDISRLNFAVDRTAGSHSLAMDGHRGHYSP